MRLSQESFYAIAAVAGLATLGPAPVLLRDLARHCDIPGEFLAKIAQRLVRGGILVSSRRHPRGYALAAPAESLTLRDVVHVTEGADLFGRCFFSARRCNAQPRCQLHELGATLRAEIESRLALTTVADIAAHATR